MAPRWDWDAGITSSGENLSAEPSWTLPLSHQRPGITQQPVDSNAGIGPTNLQGRETALPSAGSPLKVSLTTQLPGKHSS